MGNFIDCWKSVFESQEKITKSEASLNDALRKSILSRVSELTDEGQSEIDALNSSIGEHSHEAVSQRKFIYDQFEIPFVEQAPVFSQTIAAARKGDVEDALVQNLQNTLEESGSTETDIIDRLLSSKRTGGGKSQVVILPGFDPATFDAIWNTGIDIAVAAIKAGRDLSSALDEAVSYFKSQSGDGFDEEVTRKAIRDTIKPEPESVDLRHGTVQSVDQGPLQEIEHLEPIKQIVREKFFNNQGEITPEKTAQAKEIFGSLINEETKGSVAAEIRQETNADAGPGILLTELWRYAEKMTVAGDPSLLLQIIPNYKFFELLGNDSEGNVTAIGRAMRSLQETGLLFRQLFEMEKARAKAAGRQLKLGPELMETLVQSLRDAEIDPDVLRRKFEENDKLNSSAENPVIQTIVEIAKGKAPDTSKKPKRKNKTEETKTYRKFYTEKGASDFVENFFDLILGREVQQEGHIHTADKLLMSELRRILIQKAKQIGFEQKPNAKLPLSERIALILGKEELRRDKISHIDSIVRAEIDKQEDPLHAEMLSQAWDDIVGTLSVVPVSDVMLRRVLSEQVKNSNTTWSEILNDPNARELIIQGALNKIQEASSRARLGDDFPALDLTSMRRALENEYDSRIGIQKAKQEAAAQAAEEALATRMLLEPERQAKAYLDNLEKSQTEWIKPENRKTISSIIAEFLKNKPALSRLLFVEPLAARLETFGATKDTARNLANEVFNREEARWASVRSRQLKRASERTNVKTLVDAIKSAPATSRNDPAWRQETSVNWFMDGGLSREQAEAATRLFTKEFNEALANAQEKVARSVLKGKPITTIQAAVDAIRAGVFDPSKPFIDELAAKTGMKAPTAEQYKKLVELDQQMANPDLSLTQQALLGEQMAKVFRDLSAPPDIATKLGANFVATLLTGLKTLTVNVFAPISLLLSERTLLALTTPTSPMQAFKGLTSAWNTWLSQVKFTQTQDAFSFLNTDFQNANNVLKKTWEHGLEQLKSKSATQRASGLYNLLVGSQQYSMRFLNAVDQANMIAHQQAQLILYGSQAMKQLGFSPKDIDMLVQSVGQMKSAAYTDGLDQGMTENVATVHADSIVNEQMEQWLGERIGATEAKKIVQAAELDAYSTVGRLARGEDKETTISEESEGGVLSRAIFVPLIKMSGHLRKQGGFSPAIAVSLLGYVQVPLRTARYYLWNSPYGLLRLSYHHWRKSRGLENQWKQSLANEFQEKQKLRQAIAGTVVWAVLLGLGKNLFGTTADDDEPENGVFVTGKGPKNRQLRDAWSKKGFQPSSIVLIIGGVKTKIPLDRIGEPLAHLFWTLAARDDKEWRKKEAEVRGRPFNETLSESTGHAIGTYMSLLGQRGLLQQITRIGQLGGDRGGQKKILTGLAAQTASAAVTPYLGLQNSVDRMFGAPVDRSSVESTAYAAFPILGLAGEKFRKRQVNRLGDPLYDQSWFSKIAREGVPVAFRVSDIPENRSLYTLMVEKGIAPPELRRYVLEEKYGPITDEQFSEFAIRSGASIKRKMRQNLGAIRRMTPQDAQKAISKFATEANNEAAESLRLAAPSSPTVRARRAGSSTRRVDGPRRGSSRLERARDRLKEIRKSRLRP